MAETASRGLIPWFFLALFMVSLFMLGRLLWPFASIIVLAFVVTGIFSPIYRRLLKKLRPTVASLLTCLLVFLTLFIPIVLFVSILSTEAYNFYLLGKSAAIGDLVGKLIEGSDLIDRTNAYLARFQVAITGDELNRALSELGKVVGLFLYEQATAIGTNILRFVFNFFLMILIVYFLLIDAETLVKFILRLSPLPTDQEETLINKFKDIAGAILIGNGLGGLIQGIVGGVIFAVFGLNSPFLWGVIMGLLAFLPIVGIGVVFVPTSIYLFLVGRTAAGVFFLVFYALLSGTIEYILKPKLVGNRLKMHTLLVFFSIIGGLKVFGILGIIYGPLVVTAFLTLTDIYHASYQRLVESDSEETVTLESI